MKTAASGTRVGVWRHLLAERLISPKVHVCSDGLNTGPPGRENSRYECALLEF